MSPTLNGSSETQYIECSNNIKYTTDIMFVFYPGLPQLHINYEIIAVMSYTCTLAAKQLHFPRNQVAKVFILELMDHAE